jgi:prepilin-type N-terminal cleavage/methylation domain-containing protein
MSRRQSGFTLIELVVVLTVIGILAAAVAPSVMQRMVEERVQGTRDEAEAIVDAMVGDSSANRFGFVGDIGRLPTSLNELVTIGSLPAYTTSTFRSVGMGWRGPYINEGASSSDFLTDAFGRAYTLTAGQIRSRGVDGILNNADDIVYPPSAPEFTGDVTVTVKTTQGNKTIVDPNGYRVELYYSNAGSQASLSDNNDPFSFTNVPMGFHGVRVVRTSNGNVVAEDTIVIRANGTTAAELWF